MFTAATAVEADAHHPGRYHGTITDDWLAPILPHGGFTSALGMRAAIQELDHPAQRLRTLTTMFVGQVPAGPVEIDVEVLRAGRTMSHCSTRLRPRGDASGGQITIAAFGLDRSGFTFNELEFPVAPPPQDCADMAAPPPGWPSPLTSSFFQRFHTKAAVVGHPPWETDWEPTTARFVRWIRYRDSPRLPDGSNDPLSLLPLLDMMPPAIGQRLGPRTGPMWLAPSVDLTMHLMTETTTEWFLQDIRCRWAADGYASAETALWDEGRRLVAYGTQLMFFTFLDPGTPS